MSTEGTTPPAYEPAALALTAALAAVFLAQVAFGAGHAWATQLRADGKPEQELATLEAVAAHLPGSAQAENELAWRLATNPEPALRDGARAVTLAGAAVASSPDNWHYLDTLAAAYAEIGDFGLASTTEARALALASSNLDLQAHLASLRAARPIR